jgi:hypothetical protein
MLDATFHAVFEVITNSAVLPSVAPILTKAGNTVSDGEFAAWVTIACLIRPPGAEIVIVAILVTDKRLAPAVAVMALFPLPEAGLTVSQGWSDWTVQHVFDVIAKVVVLPAAAPRLPETGVSSSAGAAEIWVTSIVFGKTLVPDTVTVAMRFVVAGLADAVRRMVPFPLPEAGLTVSQV